MLEGRLQKEGLQLHPKLPNQEVKGQALQGLLLTTIS